MGGVFLEAIKGARLDLRGLPPLQRAQRAFLYTRILTAELISTIAVVPFGARAFLLHASLPSVAPNEPRPLERASKTISLAKDIRYGTAERASIDVYLPPHDIRIKNSYSQDTCMEGKEKLPVVLFVHGGTWVTGDRWHYSLFATRLAQAGIMTCVMSYSLYPESNIGTMAEEVSQALSWTLDNIARYGGDPENVSLVGHSAGAQLCALACIMRANASYNIDFEREDHCAVESKASDDGVLSAFQRSADGRMPSRLVGMAGVYDLASHYEYEQKRGVHKLSTMARASGGRHLLSSHSPTSILRSTWSQLKPMCDESDNISQQRRHIGHDHGDETLFGEGISRRAGLGHEMGEAVVPPGQLQHFSSVPKLRLEALKKLPQTILMHGCGDTVVPWYESTEYYHVLLKCEVPAKVLLYDRWVGHGDFVTKMKPLPNPGEIDTKHHETFQDLPEYAIDFVRIAKGLVQL